MGFFLLQAVKVKQHIAKHQTFWSLWERPRSPKWWRKKIRGKVRAIPQIPQGETATDKSTPPSRPETKCSLFPSEKKQTNRCVVGSGPDPKAFSPCESWCHRLPVFHQSVLLVLARLPAASVRWDGMDGSEQQALVEITKLPGHYTQSNHQFYLNWLISVQSGRSLSQPSSHLVLQPARLEKVSLTQALKLYSGSSLHGSLGRLSSSTSVRPRR